MNGVNAVTGSSFLGAAHGPAGSDSRYTMTLGLSPTHHFERRYVPPQLLILLQIDQVYDRLVEVLLRRGLLLAALVVGRGLRSVGEGGGVCGGANG